MPLRKTYRVIVHLEGRDDAIKGPVATDKEAAQRDLLVITEAQRRGTDAVVALQWLTVKERLISAAFIQEAWSGSSSPSASGRRHRTASEGYWREDP